MSDNKSNEARRTVIKSIAAGGAIVAGKSIPEEMNINRLSGRFYFAYRMTVVGR